MSGRRRAPREKDLTRRFLTGDFDADRIESAEHFGERSKGAEQGKIERTALLRAAEAEAAGNLETLPVGQVIEVYSLFLELLHASGPRLAVVRKTLTKLSETRLVVGDFVRFLDTGIIADDGRLEAVVEQVLPRKTILTRSDDGEQRPIVANAEQLLIVASLAHPRVKWGLIDRMIIAAQGGGLSPVLCLNKIDLATSDAEAAEELPFADEALAHYSTLGVRPIRTSAHTRQGLDELADVLRGKTTVLAGHSGAGKSSLITSIQPALDLRVGEVSTFTEKGRHTTTSARWYPLDIGGAVIDTPGVKTFGLWRVTRDNLDEFFPDVAADTAPSWRQESYQRIAESLPAGE